jgi:thiamine-phosphate pyrophosphorylase
LLRAPEAPIVCYVTDRKSLRASQTGLALRERIQMAVQAGADWVQIREKDMPARELVDLVRGVRDALRAEDALASAAGTREGYVVPRVVVNDRLDVALATGAAGVHLGRESVNVRDLVKWCRSGNAPLEFMIGVSCHSIEEAREVESAGANYIFFGPVFETPSKRVFGEPQGLARLAEVSGTVRIPVIAIGGVDEVNAQDCVRAGAGGIAAIRMFQEASDARVLASAVQTIQGCTR